MQQTKTLKASEGTISVIVKKLQKGFKVIIQYLGKKFEQVFENFVKEPVIRLSKKENVNIMSGKRKLVVDPYKMVVV